MTKTTYPGTAYRPILSEQEADRFTLPHYFTRRGHDGHSDTDVWQPTSIEVDPATPWVVGPQVGVDGATHGTVQQAVNAALRAQQDRPCIDIKLLPGIYTGAVYIPADAPPLTLFGTGEQPNDVVIQLALDSMFSPATYRETVNSHGEYQPGDPAWYMYDLCASKQNATIDTICAAVVWSQSDNLQMKNLTVVNALLDSVDGRAHQAVALRTDGDKIQLERVRLIGRQDTFFVNTSNLRNEYVTDRYSRAYIKDSYIEGDVDYVFGRATAVFDRVHFHTVSSRGAKDIHVFAPGSMPWAQYGFLAVSCRFTGDEGFSRGRKAKLGRAWDQGARQTGYQPNKTANGQLVIRDSTIDASYDREQPWGVAATTARPFAGNVDSARNLDDVQFNRLWEYNNIDEV
ncbi:pectinesterase PemB [Pectobacterium parmentieri]|uniref:pectinesterase PemB n=1 Tax=Pectobacterium parmentieri TaxID=1905730 RepID=UPI000CDD57CF|nr:pectinesterase PemB [Pectobacterium parmentieri]AYH07838.1 acyl-CoA thioesterase [Pectobacterium parmentieri]AYH16590.1 acyl-CoA thioesterase [Pectobacterium parmentieri]AYH25289.1 acyl-CoA thioesterase [Pectobacterium parmentieri]MBI0549661.1 putative acyl-CoA thioester hydrolase [Pectobacterium parmentieri]MBI0558678.1 putative acyl-CoA thioester hydrolase [Pectobacterium parmentieri]